MNIVLYLVLLLTSLQAQDFPTTSRVSLKQDSIWKSCQEVFASCSTYFKYWPPNETRFAGVGLALVEQSDGRIGLYPLHKSPAEKAGIPLGSTILSINGSTNLSLEAVSHFLKTGAVGDSIRLSLAFQGDTIAGTIIREPIDLSKSAPLDSEIIQRIYGGMNDSIACLEDCKKIIFHSDTTLTISVNKLAEYDYALTSAQAAAFSEDEIQYVRLHKKSTNEGHGMYVLGTMGFLGGAIIMATENTIVGLSGFLLGLVSLAAGGNKLGEIDRDLSGFILKHNQSLKSPGHKPAGKTKSIFSDPEKSKTK